MNKILSLVITIVLILSSASFAVLTKEANSKGTKEALSKANTKKVVSKVKKVPSKKKPVKFTNSKEQVKQKVILNGIKKENTLKMDSKNMPPQDPRDINPSTQF